MLPQAFLIFLSIFLFIPTFWYILKRDDVFALAYVVLFVYTIFTQIGYAFYPDLSARNHLYYGETLFYDYWLFMFLSFCFSFLLYSTVTAKFLKRYRGRPVRAFRWPSSFLFGALWIIATIYMLLEYLNLSPQLHYQMTAAELTGRVFVFISLFRCYCLMLILMYAKWRLFQRGPVQQLRYPLAVLVGCIINLTVATRIGSRSDILYVAVALVVVEWHPVIVTLKRRWRHVFSLAPVLLLVVYGLSALEQVRLTQEINPANLVQAAVAPKFALGLERAGMEELLAKDFYWPSHLLMTAMYHDLVDPVEVLRSNLANSLVGLKYPTLSQKTTRSVLASGGTDSRVGGSAFHQFIEGYLAAGWFGVFYNAVAWNMGLLCWRLMGTTRDATLNRATVGVMAYFVPSMMRGQSSIYVNWAVFWLAPTLTLLYFAANRRPYFAQKAQPRRHSYATLERDGRSREAGPEFPRALEPVAGGLERRPSRSGAGYRQPGSRPAPPSALSHNNVTRPRA